MTQLEYFSNHNSFPNLEDNLTHSFNKYSKKAYYVPDHSVNH